MKKTLLFASFICAALTASAQIIVEKPVTNLTWGNASASYVAPAKKVAQKADLKDNQVLVGLYTTDDYGTSGLGFESAVTFETGSEIPNTFYQGMNNLKVEAIRFALAQPCKINSVKLYGADQDGIYPLAQQAVGTTCQDGWNVVEFDTPISVDASLEELIPTFEATTTATDYPISTYTGSEYVSFLVYGPFGQGGATGWFSMGTDYGTVAIQLICSCDPAEGYTLVPEYYNAPTVAMNQEFKPTIGIMSTSEGAVNSIDYTIDFAGATVSSTAQFKPAIPAGFGKHGTFQPTLTAPAFAGSMPVELTITKINGEELAAPVKATYNQDVVTRIVPRYSIIEEFTGTGCGWCPRGWVGMEYVKKQCADIAGVIAIHQFNSTDPMYVATYHTPAFDGAPGAMIDRCGNTTEPYYGDNDEGIVKTVKRYAQVTPEVAINVEANYTDANMAQIDASATTEFLTDLPGSELVFVVTADGLTGTTSAWKQGNFYANYAASQMGLTKSGDPDLYEFCKGNAKGQSSITLVFDDVMIASSWPSQNAANKVAPFSTTAVGETASSAYTLTLPTKSALKNALVKDEIYVTAMVIKADGSIANAARCKVAAPAGINSVLAPAADEAAFDLFGRPATQTTNGVIIKGGKKVIR